MLVPWPMKQEQSAVHREVMLAVEVPGNNLEFLLVAGVALKVSR